jgi:hypothetical protein
MGVKRLIWEGGMSSDDPQARRPADAGRSCFGSGNDRSADVFRLGDERCGEAAAVRAQMLTPDVVLRVPISVFVTVKPLRLFVAGAERSKMYPFRTFRSTNRLRWSSLLALFVGMNAFGQELPALGEADETTVTLPVLSVIGKPVDLRDVLSPGVVSIVKPDDVKGEHKSLSDLLDQIPGVYVRRQSGSGHYTTASIRGSAPSQVNIYVDGIPMNLANETAADISTLPISNVERVEVYRGVTPARFSGAPIGGAINIVTKKPTSFSGSVSVGKRSFSGEQYAASLNFPLLGGHMLIGVDHERAKDDFGYEDYAIKGLGRVHTIASTRRSVRNE